MRTPLEHIWTFIHYTTHVATFQETSFFILQRSFPAHLDPKHGGSIFRLLTMVSVNETTCRHMPGYHKLYTHFRGSITFHAAGCSLCNSLYLTDLAATVVVPKVTESIKSGVYGFGNTKNRQQPFIRPQWILTHG